MAQMQKIGKVHTKVFRDNGYTVVRYHQTDVVRFNDSEIILDSGGWQTATTKVRMNQASAQFGLGFIVFQKDYAWFVQYRGMTVPFQDGMVLRR